METPAAAPAQPGSGPESDIVPHFTSSIPWITFGGSPNESSSAFVQAVQRIGFQQGRSRDDGWMAEYAAACFEGDAISWYTALDDEVQESWKKLRTNLLLRYPPRAVGGATPVLTPPHPASFNVIPTSVSPTLFAASTSQPQGFAGRIDVLGNHSVLLGYLSFDPTSGVDVTTDKDKAVIVSFPSDKESDVLHLDMVNVPDRVLPYIGLALLVPQQGDQNVVPEALPGVTNSEQYGGYGGYGSRVSYYGIPEPSNVCKHSLPVNQTHLNKVAFATWTFSACGESKKAALYRRRSTTEASGTRAAAAVWKYDRDAEELTLFWLMDDDTECELGGYVHNGSSNQLHVHRISDMGKTGNYIKEERVRFVFDPTQ